MAPSAPITIIKYSKQNSEFLYLGECHCQNDFLEDYDDQDRLHCFKGNSQGPCKVGEVFVQPDAKDENGALIDPKCFNNYVPLTLIGGKGFCLNGSKPDARGRCRQTHQHKRKPKCSRYKKIRDCFRAMNQWKKNQRRYG